MSIIKYSALPVAGLVALGLFLHAQDSDKAARAPAPRVPARDFNGAPTHRVLRVIDGDTVVLQLNGRETKVRLIGVDTPETVHPNRIVVFYGNEATRFLENLLKGESVFFEYEPGPPPLDKYSPTLAYLYRAPDGLFVNLEIVRQGYGHAYTRFPFAHVETFRHYERAAREAGKGLWSPGIRVPRAEEAGATPGSEAPPAPPNDPAPELRRGPPPSEEVKEATVYVTRTGSKYHRAGCRYLAKSQIPVSLKEAKQRYGACSVCRPPE